MLQLEPFYRKHEHFFITFRRPDSESLAKKERVYFIERPARNPLKTVWTFFQGLRILLKENPDVIVSTGADVAVPVCIAGKLLKKKIIFIESFCRPFVPGWSGRIVYNFADLFIYQWLDLKKYYPRGIYGGTLF
jgi:UDP-N-acetylglucosamine:LPS N-acetylglucosamine transferase